MDGILIINKPQGFTSFDVVAVTRRLCAQRKIGHAGTLDPQATGVLPLLLGSAAKAQDIIPDSDKEYTAGFRLGMTTDTLDIWGKAVSTSQFSVTADDIARLMQKYTGNILQVPPMYSAVKKDGVRMYDLARQGIETERKPRPVTVHSLELIDYNKETGEGTLAALVSKGTYIRSLIDDIGQDLGCGAVMTSLVRTRACGFTLAQAVTVEEVRTFTNDGQDQSGLARLVLPTETLFKAYRKITVSAAQSVRFANGGALDMNRTSLKNREPQDGELLRVLGKSGAFLGLGRVNAESGEVKVFKLLAVSC